MTHVPTPIAIAVVQRGNFFLVGPRPEGTALAGLWEFPGGKMEPGETPEAAAVRECLEEAGLAVIATGRFPEHVQEYDHDVVRLQFIGCRPVDVAALPREPFRWASRQELASLEFPEGNRQLIALLTRE